MRLASWRFASTTHAHLAAYVYELQLHVHTARKGSSANSTMPGMGLPFASNTRNMIWPMLRLH